MSRQNISILPLTIAITAAVTAYQFVTHAGAPAGADANTLGVARTDGAAGDNVTVDVLGTAVVIAGAAIAKGDPIASDANGQAVVMDGATYTVTVGRALEAAAAGDHVEILLIAS